MTPQATVVSGPARNMARLSAITTVSTKETPKIFAVLPSLSFSSVNPFARIQALWKRSGDHQRPPNTKVEGAAASTAK